MNKYVLLTVLAVCASASAEWVCWDPDGQTKVSPITIPSDLRPVSVESKWVGDMLLVPELGADGGYSTYAICADAPGLVTFEGTKSAVVGNRDGGVWWFYQFRAIKPGTVKILIISRRSWSGEEASEVREFNIK